MNKKLGILVILVLLLVVFSMMVSGVSAAKAICSPSTWEGDVSSDWSVAGNWDCNEIPTKDIDVIIPNTASVFPVLSEGSKVKDMEVENGASVDANGFKLTVEGTLTNNGTLKNTLDIGGGGTSFFDTGGYGGVMLTKDTGPGLQGPGLTTVTIKGNQQCDTNNTSIRRCFDIEPSNKTNISIDAVFYFNAATELNGLNCTLLKMYHWDGSGWSIAGSAGTNDCSSSPNYSIVTNDITVFSPFAGSENGPTAVSLESFNVLDSGSNMYPVLAVILIIGLLTVVGVLVRRRQTF